jgi:hypothetical protein
VRQRARRDGIPGNRGIGGNVESVTYRIQRSWQSPNPTLSAIISDLESAVYIHQLNLTGTPAFAHKLDHL